MHPEENDLIPVRLDFAMPVEPSTKSIISGTENPVSSIILLCFNDIGKLVGQYTAEVTPAGGSPDHGSLSTNISKETRSIHFIANHSLSTRFTLGTDEINVMLDSRLISNESSSQIAYWGYYKGASVDAVKDYVDNTPPNTIYLLRDRARVHISEVRDGNISKIRWTLHNGLKKGYIVPYPFNNDYYQSIDKEGVLHYYGNTVAPTPYPYSASEEATDRYTATFADLEASFNSTTPKSPKPLYLFEDKNILLSPLKLILEVTYTGSPEVVRYHNILLMDPDYQQYPIIRSHSYGINIAALPKDLGYATFAEALAGSSYSNSQTVAIDPVVDRVTDGNHFLTITEGNGVTMLYQAPASGGTKSIAFTYKEGDGTGVDDADFRAKWLEHDGITDDGTVNPVVNYNTTTGEGTITIALSSINTTLKKGTIQLQDIEHGLSRFVKVYSISYFSMKTATSLSDTGVDRNGHDVYRLSFELPDDYPAELYPVNVSFATKTLKAFSDNSSSDAHGTFGVEVRSTDELTGSAGAAATDWNYLAGSWGYWYNYTIPDAASKAVTLYMEDVTGNTSATSVGLYFSIPYFGGTTAVIPSNP